MDSPQTTIANAASDTSRDFSSPPPKARCDFLRYPQSLATELLPIAPPGSRISPRSGMRADQAGKVPSELGPHGWRGLVKFTSLKATAEMLRVWQATGAQIGMQARKFPGLDIDVEHSGWAQRIADLAEQELGAAPSRIGRAPRRLLVYSCPDTPYRACHFEIVGSDLKPVRHTVELLGAGRQYVIEGIHPKTGSLYTWPDGDLCSAKWRDGLKAITSVDIERFFAKLEALLQDHGIETVQGSNARAGGRTGRAEPDLAPSLDDVRHALESIPNHDLTELPYDDWIGVMAKVKGSTGGSEEGFALFDEWSSGALGSGTDDCHCSKYDYEVGRYKWGSCDPVMGWKALAAYAAREGDGSFAALAGQDACEAGVVSEMMERYAYLEGAGLVFDTQERDLISFDDFNARLFDVGDPSSRGKSARAVFLRLGHQRRTVRGVTYRPGCPAIVCEKGRDYANAWRAGHPLPNVPYDDESIAIWLEHVEYLVPDRFERETVLNWMAWLLQNPGLKPNWSILLGGRHGIGKDLLLNPLRRALGDNVSEISPDILVSPYKDWLFQKRLFVCEELSHMRDSKVVMQKLKTILSSPPHTLQINLKYGKAFAVPNMIAGWFFTNHRDALAIEAGERRFFCIWSEAMAREESYYDRLVEFYERDGDASVARWLLARPLGKFSPFGNAPETEALKTMIGLNLDRLDEFVQTSIEEAEGPFVSDLVLLREVFDQTGVSDFGRKQRTERALSAALLRAGARQLGRPCLLRVPPNVSPPRCNAKQPTVFAVRNVEKYVSMSGDELVAAIWAERRRADTIQPTGFEVIR